MSEPLENIERMPLQERKLTSLTEVLEYSKKRNRLMGLIDKRYRCKWRFNVPKKVDLRSLYDTDADANARDWSGKKPRQYLARMDTSLSPGSYRKSDSLDLRRTRTAPPAIRINQHPTHPRSKKESFLRIGSLNVRVKKTTEAFSNFLGVGATRASAYVPKTRDRDADRKSEEGDHLHKSWGSADNIPKDDKLMPPPMSGKVKRRGASGRRTLASHSRSTPSTPDQPRAQMGVNEEGDSDSDSAAGFHAAWRQQRASCT